MDLGFQYQAHIEDFEPLFFSIFYHELIDQIKEKEPKKLGSFSLAILGKKRSEYLEYAENIRKEYLIYPDHIYHQGRSQVLQRFLDRIAH